MVKTKHSDHWWGSISDHVSIKQPFPPLSYDWRLHFYKLTKQKEGRKEMFYLTTHSTHFIYSYMVSDIWQRTTQIVREESRCCHYMGYSFWLAARVLLYASSHRQDNTYHSLCYTSRGALAGTRNSIWVHHKGSIRQPIAPWANALTTELHLAPTNQTVYTHPQDGMW